MRRSRPASGSLPASTTPSVRHVVPIGPRVLAGWAALVISGLLLLVFLYRRRLFIMLWTLGWGVTGLSMLLASRAYATETLGWLVYGLSQFLGIVSALLFVAERGRVPHPPPIPPGVRPHPGAADAVVYPGTADPPGGCGLRSGTPADRGGAPGGRGRPPSPAPAGADARGRCDRSGPHRARVRECLGRHQSAVSRCLRRDEVAARSAPCSI